MLPSFTKGFIPGFTAIASCRSVRDLKRALQSLPKDLDETYERVLLNIDEQSREIAVNALRWLCFSTKPMGGSQLAEALAILPSESSFDEEARIVDPCDLLTLCPGLIKTYSATGDSGEAYRKDELAHMSWCFEISHFSVKEFLVSDRIRASRAAGFFLDSTLCHSLLAKFCLIYMQHFRELKFPNLKEVELPSLEYKAKEWHLLSEDSSSTSSDGSSSSSSDGSMHWLELMDDVACVFASLFTYAAECWSSHYVQGAEDRELDQLVVTLLRLKVFKDTERLREDTWLLVEDRIAYAMWLNLPKAIQRLLDDDPVQI